MINSNERGHPCIIWMVFKKHKNYLNQQFDTHAPNEVWVSDVTYYRFKEKQYFICVVMDLYARRVIAYKVGYSNNTHLAKETFRMAYELRKPESGLIFHTDQGTVYSSMSFNNILTSFTITRSMSRGSVGLTVIIPSPRGQCPWKP